VTDKIFEINPQLANDTVSIGDLPLSRILLMNESQFPWFILVPRRAQISEPYQLKDVDIMRLNNESMSISRFMMNYFGGDKLNIASLGNLVPQLHIHHIVRRHSDAVWPKPVWGNYRPSPYSKSSLVDAKQQIVAQLQLAMPDFRRC
jgi:diadenosine tetraphosphate (Ap4A) HIT family hydrolase